MNWINVSSSWVDAIYWDQGDLYVRFKNHLGKPTVVCHYENIDASDWLDFVGTSSKGKWVHAHLIGKPYKIL